MTSTTKAPPRFFHGWLIVAIAFFGSFITAGTGGYIFGQFLTPLSLAFAWSIGTVSSMATTRAVTNIFVTPFIGRLTDRIGSRPVMIAGTLLAGGAFVLASQTGEPVVFYIVYAIGVSLGFAMMGGVPAQTAVTHWFRRKRGMALSLASMGISFGGIVMVPLAQILIDGLGWRLTMAAFGVGILLLMFPPVLLFMRDYPEQMGLRPDGEVEGRNEISPSPRPSPPQGGIIATGRGSVADGVASLPRPSPPQGGIIATGRGSAAVGNEGALADEKIWTPREVLRSRNFWKQALGYMFAFGMLQVMLIYQFAFIVNRGFSSQTAALIVSGYAVCAALGRFASGFVADRSSVTGVAVGSIWLASLGVIILVLANDLVSAWLYAVVGGLGIGGFSALQSVVTAQSFGRRSFGTVAGLLNPMNQLVSAVVVPFAGFMYDATGTYNVALLIIVGVTLVSSLSLLTLPRMEP